MDIQHKKIDRNIYIKKKNIYIFSLFIYYLVMHVFLIKYKLYECIHYFFLTNGVPYMEIQH